MGPPEVMTRDIKAILRNTNLFQGLDENSLSALSESAFISSHGKGKILFISDESARNLYVVLSGWVKLFRETLDGAQAIVDILNDGHVFAETTLFENHTYPYSAEIIEPTELLSIPLSVVESDLLKNPALTLCFLKHISRTRHAQSMEIEHQTLQNASQRIGCFLLRLVGHQQTGAITLHLPYDKTLLAARLAMQPETFSRALNKLRTETALEIQGATVTIQDIQALIDYTCIACTSTYPCKDKVSSSRTEPEAKGVCNHKQRRE